LNDENFNSVVPETLAQDNWVSHNTEVANSTLYPAAASWYMGANIPGKPRIFMPYVGGVKQYRATCQEIIENGWRGFEFV
jgi:cyclohexanone monooxygenase